LVTFQSVKAGSGRNPEKTKVRRSQKSGGHASSAGSRTSDRQIQARSGRAVRIPVPLRAFLGLERDELIKVQSLLVCILQAMEVEHAATGPYYPDILEPAADSIRRRVVNLDELVLSGLLPVNQGRLGD
jgi:hypothetical protein